MSELKIASKTEFTRRSARPRARLWIPIFLALVTILAVFGAHFGKPYLKKLALEMLTEKFHAYVQVSTLDVSVFPRVRLRGTGLSLRHEGRTDVPPLISVREFSAEAAPLSLLKKPWKINWVQLKGLVITIAPRKPSEVRPDWSKLRDIPVLVGEIVSDEAELDIVPKSEDRPHHIFHIHHLVMQHVGLLRPASFVAQLTNPTPPGNIDAAGGFGPWNPVDPGQTPLSAKYNFMNADLGVFKGISGILSSHGKFGGVLSRLEVEGETETPNFLVKTSGHPINLHTTFSATVDGMNGNTLLHPVRAHFLGSWLIANGEVAKKPGAKGRTISLDVTTNNARLQDLLGLAVKAVRPPITGSVKLHTKFELPPGEADLTSRLKLTGTFGVESAEFTNPVVSEKVQTLSRKGQGKPADENAGSDVSDLSGQFQLLNGTVSMKQLDFAVVGAEVLLNGSYGLESEQLDFRGKLRLKAKLSQTMTGFKSILLKPFDPFFRKNGATQLPIKIGGTRSAPSFKLDFHHKDVPQ